MGRHEPFGELAIEEWDIRSLTRIEPGNEAIVLKNAEGREAEGVMIADWLINPSGSHVIVSRSGDTGITCSLGRKAV